MQRVARGSAQKQEQQANHVLSATVIPYQEPPAKADNAEIGSSLSTTLPMAAMFMRNKMIGWYGPFAGG
jgi:hypothetical protein